MPLFQPSNITPSSFAGVGGGTIAVENPVNITWQVNGNVPMTAFKINFYLKEVLVYTTDIIELAEPFYPTNNKGEPNFYVFTAFGKTWKELGFVNGNQYTMQIVQYWGNSTESGFYVEQFSQSAFITRTTPTLKIVGVSGEDLPANISTVSKTVSAIFQQEQGDSIDWVRWKQYRLENGEKILMYDTGVVNTAQLLFLMGNLANSNSYVIECIVQTNNGVQISKENHFYVSYDVPVIKGEYNVSKLDHASNLLEWSAYEEIEDSILGASNKDPVYENGKLIVSEEEIVAWNKINNSDMEIPTPNSIRFNTEIDREQKLQEQVVAEETSNFIAVSSEGLVVINDKIYKDNVFVGKLDFTGTGYENTEWDVYSGVFFYEYFYHTPEGEYFCACLRVKGTGDDEYGFPLFRVNGNKISFFMFLPENSKSPFMSSRTSISVVTWRRSRTVISARSVFIFSSFSGSGAFTRSALPRASGDVTKTAFTDYYIALGGLKNEVRVPISVSTSEGSNLGWGIQYKLPSLVGGGKENEGCAAVFDTSYRSEDGYYIRARIVVNYSFVDTRTSKISEIFTEIINDSQYVVQAEFNQDGSILIGLTNGNYIYVYVYDEEEGIYKYSNRFKVPRNNYVKFYKDDYLYIAGDNFLAYSSSIGSGEVELFYVKANGGKDILLSRENNGYVLRRGSDELYVSTDSSNSSISQSILNIGMKYRDLINIGVDSKYLYMQINNGGVNFSQAVTSQSAITEIQLKNEQSCNYIYVGDESSIDITMGKPTWGENVIFLTNFNLRTLQAGRVSVEEMSVEIYRTDISTKEMQKVYSASDNILALRDFGWQTNKMYTYSAYIKHGGKYTGTKDFSPATIKSCQHYHFLMEAVQDEEQPDVYHILRYWRFANNVESSAISNNNNPNFLETFTGYRLKQPSSRIGKNGVLSALISNASNGEYHDTKDQSNELFELSKSNNTFFVKDMKGNIYMVAISSAITQTINNRTITQETTIAIPWEEIGSMDNISIIQTEADKNWKEIHRN